MDWRTLLDPAGPLPRSVYWLRRVAVALVAVVVIAIIAIIAGHSGGAKHTAAVTTHLSPTAGTTSALTTPATVPATAPTTAPAAAPATTGTAAATPAPTTPAGGTCPADTLSVSLDTSADVYGPSGAPVHFTATLRTTHAEACTVAGPLVIVVTSGTDRVWGSADCVPADTAATTDLAAHSDAMATRTWDRTRSRAGCTTVVGDRDAAAGHYAAVATWGGVSSPAATFRLE